MTYEQKREVGQNFGKSVGLTTFVCSNNMVIYGTSTIVEGAAPVAVMAEDGSIVKVFQSDINYLLGKITLEELFKNEK